MNKKRKVTSVIVSGILGLTIILCIIIVAQIMSIGYVSVNGHSVFRVVTGSMEPTIQTGAILVSKETAIENVQEGDIICFRSKTSYMLGQVITHRVVKIMSDGEGNICLETRGDANTVSDGYLVTEENLIGEVIWYSGNGNLFVRILGFMTSKIGFLACIVFPVFLIGGLVIKDSIKGIQRELSQLAKAQIIVSENKKPLALEDLLTPEEYEEVIEQLKQEIMEELTKGVNQKET